MKLKKANWSDGLASFGLAWSAWQTSGLDTAWADRLAGFSTAWQVLRPTEVVLQRPPIRPDPDQLACAAKSLARAMQLIRGRGDAFNPWTAARLRQDEVRNASVLAAFFKISEVGDLAPHFLDALLRRLDGGKQTLPDLSALSRGYRVRTEDCPLGLTSERIDLTIEGDGFLIGIEVKINAVEGPDQFNRYRQTIERRAADGDRSPHIIVLARQRLEVPGVTTADWSDVAAAARRVAARNPTNFISGLLRAFATHVSSF